MKQCILSLLLGLSLFFYGHANAAENSDPTQAIVMIQKGIDAADLAMVEQYLDIDAVVDEAAAVAVADEKALREAGREPAAAVIIALGSATGAKDAIRDMLSSEAKEYVRYGVTSGAFAGNPKQDAPPYGGIFSRAFTRGARDKKIFGPATVVSQKGDTACVTTSLQSGSQKAAYPLNLLLQKQNAAWRVVAIRNFPEILHQGMQRKKQ